MDFNIEAANWDNERRANRARIIANEIIKAIPKKEYHHALEFGCGTGLVSFNLFDKFDHITMIDNSMGMIETLNRKINDFQVKNMIALQADINNGFALNKTFDVIYASMVLHHIKDTKMIIENLYKLLNDEGYLCIVDLVKDDGEFHKLEKDFDGHNGFNQEELKSLFEEVGLRNVSSNIFFKDDKTIENLKIEYSLFIMTGKRAGSFNLMDRIGEHEYRLGI